MDYTFVCYPKCTTCQKAKKFLDSHGIKCEERHITEKRPTSEELKEWVSKSGLPVKKFFNTSGMLYHSMNLKDKLQGMTEIEQIQLLSQDGMLVKRPLLIGDKVVLVGFNEEKWSQIILC